MNMIEETEILADDEKMEGLAVNDVKLSDLLASDRIRDSKSQANGLSRSNNSGGGRQLHWEMNQLSRIDGKKVHPAFGAFHGGARNDFGMHGRPVGSRL